MSQTEADKALSKAKVNLMSRPNTVFFATVCMSLVHKWDTTIPTAATNGREILYNPEFFLAQSPEVRVSIVLHETLHVVFSHMLRGLDLEHDRFNIAADYVINLIGRDAKFTIPTDWYIDEKFRGMSAEEVYTHVPPRAKPPSMQDIIRGGDGGLKPDDVAKLQADIDDIIIQAVVASSAAGDAPGSVPGAIERYVESLLNPKVPWFKHLRKFMTNFKKTNWSFKKINRRFFPQYLLPSQYGESICNIATAVDSSCSVTQELFDEFVGEAGGIIKSLKPEKLTFLQFDTRIISEDVVKSLKDLMQINFSGKGGTAIDPVMEWARDNKPTVLLIFTDGYFTPASFDPKIPIIWIIYDNPKFKADFGKVIYYETK